MNSQNRDKAIALFVLAACLFTNLVLAWLDIKNTSDKNPKNYFFKDRELQQPYGEMDKSLYAQVAEMPGELVPVRAKLGDYSPVIRWVNVKTIPVEGGGELYITLDLNYFSGSSVPVLVYSNFEMACIPISAILAALGTYLLLKSGKSRMKLLGGLFLLKSAALFWIFSRYGFFTLEAVDEQIHMNNLRVLHNLKFGLDEYQYTIGYALFLFPLYLITGDISSFVFSGICSVINFVFVSTGTLALIILIGERLGFNKKNIMTGALLLILIPWLCTYNKYMNAGDANHCTLLGAYVSLPITIQISPVFSSSGILGWTGLSDHAALFFGLAAVFLALRARKNGNGFFLMGLVAGFSCLIRMANVFYLPALIFFSLRPGKFKTWTSLYDFSAAFLLMMLPQALWNYLAFDNPFTLGYKIYEPFASRGFELPYFPTGLNLSGGIHYMLISIAGAFFFRQGRTSKAAPSVLSLLAIPTLIFYSGYIFLGVNPIRFLFLPITVFSLCAGVFLTSGKSAKEAVFLALAVFGPLLLAPNTGMTAFMQTVPAFVPHVIFGVIAVVCWFMLKDPVLVATFIVYAVGKPVAAYALLLSGGLYCLIPSAVKLARISRFEKFRSKEEFVA